MGQSSGSKTQGKRVAATGMALFFFLLLSSPPVLAQTGSWSKQPTGTMAWLHSVFFLNQNRGWAVGSKGAMLITGDGGMTWAR
ncbi:MAG TPA: hypothetical protein VKB46_17615, partial [Pyrinomonadaceae bacterium]|nr:hypothetical protein [Pyrinomonadaceae bacterium]